MNRKLKVGGVILAGSVAVWVCAVIYARAHRSQHDHAHCIAVADGILEQYRLEHGHYPYSTGGYGDAIRLATTNRKNFVFFTAEGYSTKPFEDALEHGVHVPENECGRVYVQLPGTNTNPNIVILFDKKSRRGGRETSDAAQRFVKDRDWPAFAQQQIELLVAAGIPRKQAESYYAQEAK
jgi:hypothetical protein